MLHSNKRLLGPLVLLIGVVGCISVPEDISRDFDPPDGNRPNNFGRMLEGADGPAVHPDTPTIPARDDS